MTLKQVLSVFISFLSISLLQFISVGEDQAGHRDISSWELHSWHIHIFLIHTNTQMSSTIQAKSYNLKPCEIFFAFLVALLSDCTLHVKGPVNVLWECYLILHIYLFKKKLFTVANSAECATRLTVAISSIWKAMMPACSLLWRTSRLRLPLLPEYTWTNQTGMKMRKKMAMMKSLEWGHICEPTSSAAGEEEMQAHPCDGADTFSMDAKWVNAACRMSHRTFETVLQENRR